MKKILSLALAGVFLIGSAAVAIAQESPSPEPTGERAGKIRERRPGLPKLRGVRVLHSDGVAMKADGSTVEFRHQRGTIEAVSATSITLKSPDGYTQTYSIDSETKIREKRQEIAAGDLETGDAAALHAVKSGDGYVAKAIHSLGEPGERLKAAQERRAAA